MRSIWLTTLLLVVSLAGCSHQGNHQCGPDCCPNCCDAQVGATVRLREGLSAAQWAEKVEDSDAWTRQEAVLHLAAFGRSSLCYAGQWMASSDSGVQFSGAELARLLGHLAVDTVPQLRGLLGHDEPSVRICALRALAAMPEDAAGTAVVDVGSALDADEWEVRYHAAQTLQYAGYRSRSQLQHLEHRSHHDLDARVRTACAAAKDAIQLDWGVHARLSRGG